MTKNVVKQHVHETFPYKTPLREEKLLEIVKFGTHLVMFNVILKYPRTSENLCINDFLCTRREETFQLTL